MGFIFSKPANKKTKSYDFCKKDCWNSIKTPLQTGFEKSYYKKVEVNSVLQPDLDSFVYRLKTNREILTIGCSNCKVPCANNCMTILVLNEKKTKILDSDYLVIAFKNFEAANKYLDAYYPNRTTEKFNDSFFDDKSWKTKSSEINKGTIDYKNGLSEKRAYEYIQKLYSQS